MTGAAQGGTAAIAAHRYRPRRLAMMAGVLTAAGGVAAGLFPLADPVAAGLVVMTIGFWAIAAFPEHLTALLFFFLAMALSVAPSEVVFGGFAATAMWLVFGGLVLAGAVQVTGLGGFLADRLMSRIGGGYSQVVGGIVILSGALAFLVPSTMARVMLLLPIINALADRLGYAPDSRGRVGMLIATMLSTYLTAAAILPANVPNLVMVGAVEQSAGLTIRYGDYFLLHFPVLGFLKGVLVVAVITALFGEPPGERGEIRSPHQPPALNAAGRRLGAILAVTLVLWSTDAVHHVSPAWVGLGAALICLWPGVGILPGDVFARQVNLAPVFYVAAVLAVARLAQDSGLGEGVAGIVLAWLPAESGHPASVFAALSAAALSIGVVGTMPSVPVVLTPGAPEIADVVGWSIEAVVMAQVMGFSTVVLPYQVPPLMVGAALAGIRLGLVAWTTLILAALSVVLLWPLAFLWWRVVGVIP